jgi:sirohydrochlorin ferrochelatase
VQIGYLDHGTPLLAEVDTVGAIVVPLLLSTGFHVKSDIPAAAPDATITAAVGPDPLLAAAVADRLREAGWREPTPIVLAATGSADPQSIGEVEAAATQLAAMLGVEVKAAFISGGGPRLTAGPADAVASYLLASGHFADEIAGCGAGIVSAPIGADPRVAEIILRRYAEALRD